LQSSEKEAHIMTMLVLNTLAIPKKLTATGVPERQAEAQAEALAEIVETTLAARLDITGHLPPPAHAWDYR